MRLPEALDTPLRTAAALVVVPVSVLLYGSAAILLAWFGASAARVHRAYTGFARVCLRVGATELRVHGSERARPGTAYVVVSNHQSAWDPVCIIAALPQLSLRFVAKRAIMRIPVMGQALRWTGNVTVVRTHTAGDVKRIQEGMDKRDAEASMLFFAEGGRSRDARLHPFKMGAFATAISYGLPVLPVAVAGTFEIWPKGTLRVRRGAAAVEIGEPIPVAGRKHEDRGTLRDECRVAVARLAERAQQRLRAPSEATAGGA